MDHDLRVGQRHALALGPRSQQEGAHAGRHTNADGGDITLDVLHGVINGHSRRNRPAGAVDVELNVLVRVLGLQVQQLGHHEAGGGVVDLLGQEDDPVVEQTGEDVIGPLSPVGLFDYIGH